MADSIVVEEWRSVKDWPYEVSNLGRVRRAGAPGRGIRVGLILACARDAKSGHIQFNAWKDGRGKTLWVHRVVCEAFHGDPPSPEHEAAHWDGDPGNNRATNLRWATHAENGADMARHGTRRGLCAKLDQAQVREIRRLFREGVGSCAVARQFGVALATVVDIKFGRTWAWLAD